MGLMRPKLHVARIIGIICALQELLQHSYSNIEVKRVPGADNDMNLTYQLWTKRFPVAFKDMPEVVMVAPIRGYGVINHTGHGIPNWFRISIRAHRAKHRLPAVVISGRSPMSTQHQFKAGDLLHGAVNPP